MTSSTQAISPVVQVHMHPQAEASSSMEGTAENISTVAQCIIPSTNNATPSKSIYLTLHNQRAMTNPQDDQYREVMPSESYRKHSLEKLMKQLLKILPSEEILFNYSIAHHLIHIFYNNQWDSFDAYSPIDMKRLCENYGVSTEETNINEIMQRLEECNETLREQCLPVLGVPSLPTSETYASTLSPSSLEQRLPSRANYTNYFLGWKESGLMNTDGTLTEPGKDLIKKMQEKRIFYSHLLETCKNKFKEQQSKTKSILRGCDPNECLQALQQLQAINRLINESKTLHLFSLVSDRLLYQLHTLSQEKKTKLLHILSQENFQLNSILALNKSTAFFQDLKELLERCDADMEEHFHNDPLLTEAMTHLIYSLCPHNLCRLEYMQRAAGLSSSSYSPLYLPLSSPHLLLTLAHMYQGNYSGINQQFYNDGQEGDPQTIKAQIVAETKEQVDSATRKKSIQEIGDLNTAIKWLEKQDQNIREKTQNLQKDLREEMTQIHADISNPEGRKRWWRRGG